jgi:DNA-binding GntR family transcriptional regulator
MDVVVQKQTPTQSELAYQGLRRDILQCRLMPGAKIKMKYVCDTYDVSLGAAREALARLSADGLAIAEAQRGFAVAPVSWEEYAQLTEARSEIEVSCLRKSILNGDIEWEVRVLAGLHRLLHVQDDGDALAAAGPSPAWIDAHTEFHLALVSACPNKYQLGLRNELYTKSERYRFLSQALSIRLGQRNARKEHSDLAKLAQQRKADLACELMKEHFSRTVRDMLDAVGRAGGDIPHLETAASKALQA